LTGIHDRFYPDRAGTIQWCRGEVSAGDGASTTQFNVLKNGSSIYVSATKPDVAAGSFVGATRAPDGGTVAFTATDYIQVNVLATGGSTGRLKLDISFTYSGV
jgi:hypothetical protein